MSKRHVATFDDFFSKKTQGKLIKKEKKIMCTETRALYCFNFREDILFVTTSNTLYDERFAYSVKVMSK